jgi:hypothetical protein
VNSLCWKKIRNSKFRELHGVCCNTLFFVKRINLKNQLFKYITMFVAFMPLHILFLVDECSYILFFVSRDHAKVEFDLNSNWIALYENV